MADTPILNYKGKHDGPEIDKAVELALGLENPKSCPYYVHVSLSQPDYVLTIGLGDAEGNLFNHTEIDLPLESMVVNATYENGNIILHLQDGTSTEPIPISALIAGLVSETRTIAGIDLKDDITQKELRDALGVYTKDSVDQLVSDLEDRINETLNEMERSLNDLSDLTSEHDTQIKKNTSDISTNKSDIANIDYAVGSPSKNLFDFDTWKINALRATLSGTAEEVENGFKLTATANDCFTGNSSINATYKIPVRPNTNYIISWDADNDIPGSNYVFFNGVTNNNKSNNNQYVKRFSFTTHSDTTFITVRFGVSTAGNSITYSNIMIRPADITDSTYESYKPSVNERLSELTPQVEQNKSDISLLEENKMPWKIGTVTANENAQKWYKLATFRTTVLNNAYNSAFYIQDRKNNETGILHISVERVTSGGLPSVTLSRIDAHWISAEHQSNPNFKKRNNFVVVGYIEENYLVCELWCRVYEAYGVYYALQLTNTRQSVNVSNTTGWILEKTSTPYDNHPEASDTVRVVKTVDKLAEALEKIDDFETRITALENK